MSLTPEDVHALTIIASQPRGEIADRVIKGLSGETLEVARGLRGKTKLSRPLRSAVRQFQNFATAKS